MDALTKLGYIYIKEGDYDVASMFLRQELEAGERYQNRRTRHLHCMVLEYAAELRIRAVRPRNTSKPSWPSGVNLASPTTQ